MLSPATSDPAALSPGHSSCCSDTGDVLIRSTRIVLPDRKREAGELTQPVQKSRDPSRVQSHRAREKQRLQKARHNPETVEPARAATDYQTGQELQTSCFKAGGRGVVSGASRQRCHSTHHKREVSVQSLEPRPTPDTSHCSNAPDRSADDAAAAVQTEASSGRSGDLSQTAAAAAAAAAVAAAAPLIKAQSDIEAQMSQLSEGIQKSSHTNREGDGQGRSSSQHTSHHSETSQSQQSQSQSQLSESAIRIVTGHGSMTSDSKDKDQRPSSSGTGGPTILFTGVPTDAVTKGTYHCDSRPDQTRNNSYLQDPVAESVRLQSLANDTQEAVKRASDMSKQMECSKTEIKMLSTHQEGTPDFTSSAPDCHQIQRNQPEPQQTKSKPKQTQFQFHQSNSDPIELRPKGLQQSDSHNTQPQFKASYVQHKESYENMGQHSQCQPNPSRSHNRRPFQTPTQDGPLLTHHSLSQNVQKQSSQGLHASSHHSHPPSLQRRPAGSSMSEEAGQVLRQARRRKKVSEHNSEAMSKAKTGEILHCQSEALAANRDLTEEVRIKKTVDAWINALSRDIQDHPQPPPHERSPVDAIQCRAANATKPQPRASGRGKPMSMSRGTSKKAVMGRGSRDQTAGNRMEAEPVGVSGSSKLSQQHDKDGEVYSTRSYGKLPYEGLRRTLKKSPYPRFSSPVSPSGRKQRPRSVESIRGVRSKSCKTQTSFTPVLALSTEQPSQHPAFGSSHLSLHDSAPPPVSCVESSTGARAIPSRQLTSDIYYSYLLSFHSSVCPAK